ncbi:MAG: transposase, partial [Anaerolineales bacterium]
MFQENNDHKQESFFSVKSLLPKKLWDDLSNSWAGTFYQEVFCRIDEKIFAPLYSDKDSRPNIPVNVLVALEILKSGFGWSDEELYEQAKYNLQVRLALGLHNLSEDIFTERTIYNFRRRVREYAQETGINLMQKVFEQITDAQLEAVSLKTGWQRMDSTQVLSNLAKMTRLELMVAVLQAVYKQLEETNQERYEERWEPYLEGRPHQVCFKIPAGGTRDHLLTIGKELDRLETELVESAPESEALPLVQRVLKEQYIREEKGALQLRPGKEITTDSLQSPHDLEATYRFKGGKEFRGGYVVNVSETADEDNPFQLITDVQVEPNQTDDAELMEQSLDGQAERDINVEKVTTDGGYTGPTGEKACEKHNVELRATRMRGGTCYSDQFGWEQYGWEINDKDGTLRGMTCPEGCQAKVEPGWVEGKYIVRFETERCKSCPFFKEECRVQDRARVGPTIYINQIVVDAARRRQQLHPEDTPVRVVVESTIRSFKRGIPGSKLPVRGLIRSRMMLYLAPLMVNVRRLHDYLSEKEGRKAQK